MAKKNAETNAEKLEGRAASEANLVPFEKGQSGNPDGKRKGQRNYKTIYRLALEEIAEAKGLTADDIEVMIEMKAIERAIKGDARFSIDIKDRVHGKAVQTNINVDTNDVELDQAEIDELDNMLAKFIKKPAGTDVKVVKKKTKPKAKAKGKK